LVARQTECGKRTDITYCDWGPPYYKNDEWQGGCWRIGNTVSDKSKCERDKGRIVEACPKNTLVRPQSSSSTTPPSNSQYCFYSNDCYIIGVFYIGGTADAYFAYTSYCTYEGGAIVTRDWCVTNDYPIRDN
jgi:hypothetical protein